MKVDFSTVLKDINGNAMKKDVSSDDGATLGSVCTEALMAAYKDEEHLSGEEKFKRFELAKEINDAEKELDISPENVTLLRKLVGKAYSVAVVGPVYKLLN